MDHICVYVLLNPINNYRAEIWLSEKTFIDIELATVSVWSMEMQPIVILVIRQLLHITLLQPCHVIFPFAIYINAKSFHVHSSSILTITLWKLSACFRFAIKSNMWWYIFLNEIICTQTQNTAAIRHYMRTHVCSSFLFPKCNKPQI